MLPVAQLAGRVWAAAAANQTGVMPIDLQRARASQAVVPTLQRFEGSADKCMQLQTTDDGVTTIHELRVLVAASLFPVLSNLVDDLSIDESDLGATVVPLNADACPTGAVGQLIRLGDAIVGAAHEPDYTTRDSGQLYYEHADLLGSTVAELVALVNAANFLGSDVVADIGCFALAVTLTAISSPTQAQSLCLGHGVAVDPKVPPHPESGNEGGAACASHPAMEVPEPAAAADRTASNVVASVDACQESCIPFVTKDNVITLVPMSAVRMMHAVQPFVELGCISPLDYRVSRLAMPQIMPGATVPEIARAVGWLQLHAPAVHDRFVTIVHSLLGIQVEMASSAILSRVVAYCEHHKDDPPAE
jgi:hypothetical protein